MTRNMKHKISETIRAAILKTLEHEGGFVNNPRDPGGPTNMGFTLKTMIAHGMDVNDDDIVDINDVKCLTKPRAMDYYAELYFFDVKFHLAPECLQEQMFDHGVLFGQHNAVRLLQKLLNAEGFYHIATDGIMGPRTANAAKEWLKKRGTSIMADYCIARRDAAFAKAERYPNLQWAVVNEAGNKGGWIIRIEDYLPPVLSYALMSECDFQARTADWQIRVS